MASTSGQLPPGAAHAAVKRELLVRYLDAAVPVMLHGARRFTYVERSGPQPAAGAALRVFGEFADLFRARRLAVLLVDGAPGALDAVRAELDDPGWLDVRAVPEADLAAALTAAGAKRAPVFAYLDAVGARASVPPLTALAANPHGEALLALDGPDAEAGSDAHRAALRRAGFPAVADVELVDERGARQMLLFAAAGDKGLDRFKNALWAVDEFAGVRYRDPRDREHALLDISLSPHLGPLRRALVDRVRAGACSVADLQEYARTETIYRAADATRALTALMSAGTLARSPERGRLTADTQIRLAAS
jgi:hypothetical protein